MYEDGFRADKDESSTLVFSERTRDKKGLFYIHGGLHLFNGSGGVRKHSWKRSGNKRITELVEEGLQSGQYPLFVAEGKPEHKLSQIAANSYLHYCLGKLSRIQSPLVTIGFSFGESDGHIEKELVEALEIPVIYMGVFGPLESETNRHFNFVKERMEKRRQELLSNRKKSKKFKELEIVFYDSSTASVWD